MKLGDTLRPPSLPTHPPQFRPDKTKIEPSKYDTECQCCGYEADDLDWYRKDNLRPIESTHHRDHFNLFCHICASTFLSLSVTHPRSCQDSRLHQSLGWIANHLLAAIKELKNG